MYRNTYVEIDLDNIKYNIELIKNKNSDYKYYIGVVKADCYGHYGNETIKAIIDGGCNYLAVSSLEEALEIRKCFDIPILCLGIINPEYINECIKNNITITIPSLEYVLSLKETKNLKAHIKLDTGMNRLGIKDKEEFNKCLKKLEEKNIYLEGIYTHLFMANSEEITEKQIEKFMDMTKHINVDIFHVSASDGTLNYKKIDKINGCRLGIAMYGLSENDIGFKDTFKLVSKIIQIKEVKKDETVSYNGTYKANKNVKIGIIPIGYADGVIRKYKGNNVYIKNKSYKIIGNICMDMLMVEIDDEINVNDEVLILKDNKHIRKTAEYIGTIPYEIICNIGKRVPRIYKKS